MTTEPIRPNLELQTELHRIASAAVGTDEVVEAADLIHDILRLYPKTNDEQIELIRQIADAWARNQEEEVGLGYVVILQYLQLDDSNIAIAVLPYQNAESESLRRVVSEMLAGVEMRSGLTIYTGLIETDIEAGRPPNQDAVERMIRARPSDAMFALGIVLKMPDAERKDIAWRVHEVDETLWKQRHGFLGKDEVSPAAQSALDDLSRHSEWWVRRYVVEIMQQHPEFKNTSIVDRLAKDDHPSIVREATKLMSD